MQVSDKQVPERSQIPSFMDPHTSGMTSLGSAEQFSTAGTMMFLHFIVGALMVLLLGGGGGADC